MILDVATIWQLVLPTRTIRLAPPTPPPAVKIRNAGPHRTLGERK